jgi:RNA polymerase sigma-70 factor (ECF subfamily)
MDVEGINVGIGTETSDDPYALYVSILERNHVREAIEQLPADFREIILLREFEELSYQENGHYFGLSSRDGHVAARTGAG